MKPTTQLRYTVDITRADVDAIETFLASRVDAQFATHPLKAAEYRMARTARNLIESAVWEARDALDTLQDGEEGSRDTLSEWHRLNNAWNRLVDAAVPWRDEAGHDPDRWRRVTHTDRSYEASYERGKAVLEAKAAAQEASA
ncbi:hypothetical protein [Streptomyces hydrogenans]|uniref:hypothetical protein n=1 Tax=Streptomyces hydrogenans TaxID=1873719 RepID=UPI0036EE1491